MNNLHKMNTVIKLPWIDDDEYLDFLQSCQKFQFFSKKISKSSVD